jgi:hypothetical protein|tara:strand:+ start:401 stop:628 length:228 start_codon:yes stop_codon:yes gene_type:complete
MANYIEAIKTKLTGQRNIEIADLEVYLSNPVAIGEHPNIGEEIEKKIENIDGLDSKIDTITKYFTPKEVVENEES